MRSVAAVLLLLGGVVRADERPFRVVLDANGVRRETRVATPPLEASPGEATDRAENGGFDASDALRAWSGYDAPPYGVGTGTAVWSGEDAGGQRGSGSVLLTNTSPTDGPREYGLQQCLRPARPRTGPGNAFRSRLSVRIPPGQAAREGSYLAAMVVLFASEDCSSGFLGGGGVALPLTAAGTLGWQELNPDWASGTEFFVNGGSALLAVSLTKEAGLGDPIEAYVDDIGVRGVWQPSKGDLNRDGETDLLLREAVTGHNSAWFMRDERRLGEAVELEPAPKSADWHIAGVDDFDGDGEQDLLMWNGATGETEFWLMNGTTRIGPPVPLPDALPPNWKPVATADFDGDGRPDLLYRDGLMDKLAKQKLVVWTLKGTAHSGTVVPSPDHAVNFNWDVVAARDLDGDGHTDLVWFNRDSGRAVYWLFDGQLERITGAFTNPMSAGDKSWRVVAAGDFGLGPAKERPATADSVDLVWRHLRSGRLAVWFMDKQGNRTGGRLISPALASNQWTVSGPH